MARIAPSLQPKKPDSTRTLVAFAAVIAALYFGREILIPIALAILLSFVLAPLVRLLHNWGLGRALPVAITVLIAFVTIAGLGALIATQLKDLLSGLPRYQTTLVSKVQTVQGLTSGVGLQRAEDAIANIRKAMRPSPPVAAPAGGGTRAPGPNETAPETAANQPIPVQVTEQAPGPLETVMRLASPLLNPIATTFIVLIFVVFILLQREDLRNRAIRLFGANDLQRTTAAIDDGAKRLSGYLLTQLMVNAGAGFVIGMGLWIIGVPSPVLLGILFACLRFVPYVGSLLGTILPAVLAAAVDPGWTMMVWTLVMLVVVEVVISQAIEPLAYGHNTGLSPIAIVLAATFWTALWGPVGLLLSTPLTVCLVVLGRHVEQLEFLDVMLGDSPPLSAPEIFYQRMLAKDPVEACDQARRCLNDMSIAEYFDAVALPGLLLAQQDAAQGRLDLEHQSGIRSSALETLEDLEGDEPVEDLAKGKRRFWQRGDKPREGEVPPPSELVTGEVPERLRAAGSVLCLGARGPLDDAAAAMLTQVLASRNIGARWESYALLAKTEIDKLDVTGVALVCLSALDGSSPAFLRFVIRRLRRRAPETAILVGAWWRRDGLRASDEQIDEVVRDPKVASFEEVIRFCLDDDAKVTPGEVAKDGARAA